MEISKLIRLIEQEITEVGKTAKSEEDVRLGCESILKNHLPQIGVQYDARYEVTVSNGRIDALFHHLITEYKEPGKLATRNGYDRATEQALQYIENLAKENKESTDKYIAVLLDGKNIGFVRFNQSNKKIISPLLPINFESIRLFLKYIHSLNYKALTTSNVLSDFGPQSKITGNVIRALWSRFQNHRDTRTSMYFTEWRRLFGQVSGFGQFTGPEHGVNSIAKQLGIDINKKPAEFIFVLHTYYSILIKLIAVFIIENAKETSGIYNTFKTSSLEEKKSMIESMENGTIFRRLGITNFLEGDFFAWYLNEWDESSAAAILEVQECLCDYEPSTPSLMPESVRDLLKTLYERLLPKQIRHDLGEFYTPDWLAHYTINASGFLPSDKILDPTCGSGTFLVLCIKEKIDQLQKVMSPDALVKHILSHVYGFDLNPLAVIASRTNYLLALGDLLGYADGDIEIPVYLSDAILSPQKQDKGYTYRIETTMGPIELIIPDQVVSNGFLGTVLIQVEELIIQTAEQFCTQEQARKHLKESMIRLGLSESISDIVKLYDDIMELEKKNWNRIWCRIIKNHFSSATLKNFDVIVGNPPWLRWTNLPDIYRNSIKEFCVNYGLFSKDRFVGGIETDISTVILYSTAEKWLKQNGKLAFLITRSVFKTESSEGFRKFEIPNDRKTKFRVMKVEDFTSIKPFEGATNKPALILLEKGNKNTEYPVPWIVWSKKNKNRISDDSSLQTVIDNTIRSEMSAYPIYADGGPWLTLTPEYVDQCIQLINRQGEHNYPARKGICTDRNGIYYGAILDKRGRTDVIFENNPDLGRTTGIPIIRSILEKDLIYPIARGREVSSFQWEFGNVYGIVPQDKMDGFPEDFMRLNYNKTLRFFREFENNEVHHLTTRGSFRRYQAKRNAPFYSSWNVGEYTFAPYKVAWSEISGSFQACVLSSISSPYWETKRIVIPDHKLYFVPLYSESEAHFLCALLNAPQIEEFVMGYVETTQIGTHVTEYLNLPKFDESNDYHQELSQLSLNAHHDNNLVQSTREKISRLLHKII
ncbi:N-6 DNA methylase [Brevibacillus parabrevis]|uniref:Eco57I restriction-modification methylase domain-containing protein n=1 Tax=Brevibacillus parabrevis TaxID=54914 RepID=UPI001C243C2D|nr:N-6 DNA methylase [Brevibacillus parabrevis]MBU8711118.1 N-6 DNA methylase [Brevibacillus parabrevis]